VDNGSSRAYHDTTAYAEFTDVSGNWWRTDEDGNVNQIEPDPAPPSPNPVDPAAMPGLTSNQTRQM
jgi:hypothetical protein